MGIRYAIALDALGRAGMGMSVLEALAARDTADSRIRGMLGRDVSGDRRLGGSLVIEPRG